MTRDSCALMLLGVVSGVLAVAPAFAFPSTDRWDPLPLDTPMRPPAWVGAAIAATDAQMNARTRNLSDRTAGARPGQSPVQPNCTLSIGSVTLPSRASNQTIVANADVRGTIIQVCR